MKIVLSKEDKIVLLTAIKTGVLNTDSISNILAKVKNVPSIDSRMPILTDEDIQKIIEINNL